MQERGLPVYNPCFKRGKAGDVLLLKVLLHSRFAVLLRAALAGGPFALLSALPGFALLSVLLLP